MAQYSVSNFMKFATLLSFNDTTSKPNFFD